MMESTGAEAGMSGTAEAKRTAGWAAWREARLSSVNAPDGPAALTRTVWLSDAVRLDDALRLGAAAGVIPGVPGRWAREGEAVRVQLAAGEDALLDGSSTTGTFLAYPMGEAGPSSVAFPRVTVQVVRRSGRLALRLFDHDRAGAVERIDAFPPSRAWEIEGDFVTLPAGTSQLYDFAADGSTMDLSAAGAVSLVLGGRSHDLRPFRDGTKLVLVFSDATTGATTRGPCRFVEFDPPAGEEGRVVVDFNRAYLPPCAFSDEFNCPLPPPGHRFATPITAGEIDVTWKSVVVSAG
jgi:hypothetical protein